MIIIKKIKIQELQDFVATTLYASLVDKPISFLRVQSYINNPNASVDDVVLYMAFIENKLVAYRTLLVDTFTIKNKPQKFAWLSGNWTHPNYRRNHISTRLFEVIFADWNGSLMYTNYALASKAVYDKTTHFECLKTLDGYRFYRRICFADILVPKASFYKTIKPMLSILDWSLNLVLDMRFLNTNKSSAQVFDDWDEDMVAFLAPFKEKELFQRDIALYSWIQNHPWIGTDTTTKLIADSYYFSSYAEKYQFKKFKLTDTHTGKITGIIIISIRDGHLKIPYLYILPVAVAEVKNLIFDLCKKYKINYVTSYHSILNTEIRAHKNPFLTLKKFKQNYFATKKIQHTFFDIKTKIIQVGDGDYVFT